MDEQRRAAIAPPGSRWRTYPDKVGLGPLNYSLRVETAEPLSDKELRRSIRAAGEACMAARRKGWINAQQERLQSVWDDAAV